MTSRRALGLVALGWLASACGRDAAPVIGDPPLPGVAAIDPWLELRLQVAAMGHAGAYLNRLALETSPYLLQHAHNPVNWYAWGDAPFERARREHKLVLVSIGYSTCHWCHVMEAESFEDPEVAAFLNANFICIKVDREERPDLDALYLRATIAMTGDGGWPMNLITDDQRRPVFAATYLPKARLLGVARQLRALQTSQPEQLAAAARQLVEELAADPPRPAAAVPGPSEVERGARDLARGFDPDAGGFGRATKFPSPPELELLLRYHHRTGDPQALAMVQLTLARIAAGGIHDQLGGGFHRYATDRYWLVPHFEKMLYDNAQLAVVYLEASQITGEPAFAEVARTTIDYVLREMTSPDGAFYSATDADSRGPGGRTVEGYYFTWTAAELEAVLGPVLGRVASAWYAVGGSAAVDGRSILHTPRSLDELASTMAVAPAALRDQLEAARAALLAARLRRPPPARDDKVVTEWNGLMISALAKAGLGWARPDYLRAAARAAGFALTRLRTEDGGLHRSWRAGEARQAGTLEDYAALIAGLLDLFEATTDPQWLTAALELGAQLEPRFGDPEAGGYFMADRGGERLLVRTKPIDDGVQPSGNALAVSDLLRLGELTGDPGWRTRAERALTAFGNELAQGSASPALRAALDRALDTPFEIVIVAPRDVAEAEPLVAEVRRRYLPDRALVVATAAELPALARVLPMVEGKLALDGQPTAFVCERARCRQPTHRPAELAAQLARVVPLLRDRSPAPLR